MKATLVIPCWNSAATLPRIVAEVRAQTLDDFEAIFIDDGSIDDTARILATAAAADARIRVLSLRENRGVSAARNAGLDAACGKFIFFADPDDSISSSMLEKGVAAMEKDDADYCVFPHRERFKGEYESHLVPLKGKCRHTTNEDIVRLHMSRMFGYSFDHVKEWYAGTPLFAHRVHGGVWSCVYRRSIIESYHIRFDKRISLYEDAMFNCAYMMYAQRMTYVDEPLYEYIHGDSGAVARQRKSLREIENKIELLRVRIELDSAANGHLTSMYAASCVFSVLEMLKIAFTTRAPFTKSICLVREYMANDVVRNAVAGFPISIRHPILALAVITLRMARCCLTKGRMV
jgi:glycosyltransferase involved in cell wall biosynthesis